MSSSSGSSHFCTCKECTERRHPSKELEVLKKNLAELKQELEQLKLVVTVIRDLGIIQKAIAFRDMSPLERIYEGSKG